jgi:hypothetical protein
MPRIIYKFKWVKNGMWHSENDIEDIYPIFELSIRQHKMFRRRAIQIIVWKLSFIIAII